MKDKNNYLEMDGLYWESPTHEWFYDKKSTNYAQTDNGLNKDALPNIYCFVVREKETGDYNRVVMDKKTNAVIYDSGSLEDISFFIDRLKLKEKGFNKSCFGYYTINKNLIITDSRIYHEEEIFNCQNNVLTYSNQITSPLYQQVVDWLREKHKLNIITEQEIEHNNFGYISRISERKEFGINHNLFQTTMYENYYDALSKSIEESLNLI